MQTKKQRDVLARSALPSARLKTSVATRADELLADHDRGLPIWIRAPKKGTEFYTGLSRSKLYEGAAAGHFRSVSIREPGQTKGTRLFLLSGVLEFINRCSDHFVAKKNAQKGRD